jgi:hypothetical protein
MLSMSIPPNFNPRLQTLSSCGSTVKVKLIENSSENQGRIQNIPTLGDLLNIKKDLKIGTANFAFHVFFSAIGTAVKIVVYFVLRVTLQERDRWVFLKHAMMQCKRYDMTSASTELVNEIARAKQEEADKLAASQERESLDGIRWEHFCESFLELSTDDTMLSDGLQKALIQFFDVNCESLGIERGEGKVFLGKDRRSLKLLSKAKLIFNQKRKGASEASGQAAVEVPHEPSAAPAVAASAGAPEQKESGQPAPKEGVASAEKAPPKTAQAAAKTAPSSGRFCEDMKFGGTEFSLYECGGGGDCFFRSLASQIPDSNSEEFSKCRRDLYVHGMGEIHSKLDEVKASYHGGSELITRRIDVMMNAMTLPMETDNFTSDDAQKLEEEIKNLEAEIRWVELGEAYKSSEDVDVKNAAEALLAELAKKEVNYKRLIGLHNVLMLRVNLSKIPSDDHSSEAEALRRTINNAIIETGQSLRKIRLAAKAGYAYDLKIFREKINAMKDNSLKMILERSLGAIERYRDPPYTVYDKYDELARLAARLSGFALPWTGIGDRFEDSAFEKALFSVGGECELPSPSRALVDGRWRNSAPSRLGRRIGHLSHAVLEKGAWAGDEEQRSACLAYERPVVFADTFEKDGWTLAVPLGGSAVQIIVYGDITFGVNVKNDDGTNPIYESKFLLGLQAACEKMGLPMDTPGYVTLSELIVNREALTYGKFREEYGREPDTGTIEKDLLSLANALMKHCFENKACIGCCNKSGVHWQAMLPKVHTQT